jgi:hypothetical protein
MSANKTTIISSRRSRWYALAVLAIGLAGLGDDCDGDVLNDSTFRDWCGDTLCSWTLDSGQIARVPTWDANDFGVSFLDSPDGKPTEISQVTSENSATCLLFTSVGDIDPAAMMSLWLDFDNDGTIDSKTALGATQWQRVQAEITAPAHYNGITFYLRKDGTGTAILAEMRVQSTTGCTATPVTLSGLALGEPCSGDLQCASQVCDVQGAGVCSQCTPSSDASPHPCAPGVRCVQREIDLAAALPLQCGPHQGLGLPGAPCIGGDDCKSGSCMGASTIPPGGPDAGDAGACDLDAGDAGPYNCFEYSVHGGTCN